VNLTWEAPVGEGAAAIVDYYRLTVMPEPVYQPQVNVTTLSSQIVLEYNQSYHIAINPVNCVGSRDITLLYNIHYSESNYNVCEHCIQA
jgi:hypothetical protein